MAEGGTLFLDEIGELSPQVQAQLLRFLQDKEFERLGEGRTRRADVRIVAATNRDLEQAVKDGRFREDLLYRLNVIEVRVPTLRERREDILPLARSFVGSLSKSAGRAIPQLSPETESLLKAWSWPGNVRELRNAIERALIVWPSEVIPPAAFPDRISGGSGRAAIALGGRNSLEEIEREHILRVLAATSTLDEAAEVLGIDASTLWRKRKKYESE
jgi:NtrC-family two-component system response regulator AlgB